MRGRFLAVTLLIASCATTGPELARAREQVVRDVEGYAIASCLVNQAQPYLRDQGDAWASAIVQRMRGDLELITAVAAEVKRELGKGNIAVIRDESAEGIDKVLPVLYCNEIIDAPAVRAAIKKSVAALSAAYGQ